MRIRRLLALIVSVVMLCATVSVPFCAFATVTADSGKLEMLPGNTQSCSPSYSPAWLDNIIIRDDATAITAAKITPRAEYPYSKTYDEFIREVGHYSIINTINEETVEQSYDTVLEVLYYMVTALGMTDSQEVMRSYISDYGIRLPSNTTTKDKIKTAVVYAALKYNALYVLYEKDVSFPKGITLDAAAVVILAAVTGTTLPSGIDTVTGFGVLCVKNYVEQFEDLPISANPESSEIFHWAKIVTAAAQEYEVPLVQYDQTSQAQKDYVDYAYYASVFDTIYDIHINPIALVIADQSVENDAVAKLILKTMLDEKKAAYNADDSSEKLFKLACENGCFELDKEFYSDVFNYDITVDKKCEKLWFTPFALADQLEGDNKYVSIMLGDKKMAPSATTFAPLNPKKAKETVTMVVSYDDKNGRQDTVTYTFNVIKVNGKKTQSDNEILNKVQDAVNSVVPQNNAKATGMVNDVFSAIDSKIHSKGQNGVDATAESKQSVLSTYPEEETGVTKSSPKNDGNGGLDFDYLEELLSETFVTDENGNIVTTDSILNGDEEDTSASFVERTVTAIKENPEVAVAAPTSIIAIGGFFGYMFSKKRKDAIVENNDNETSEE